MSERLDTDDGLLNALGHARVSYPGDACGSQHIRLHSENLLQPLGKLHEAQADGAIKLRGNVDVALLGLGPRAIDPKRESSPTPYSLRN